MAGSWRDFDNDPNFNVSTMLLLTDGSVLCQVFNSQQWRRLTPDDQGQYSLGTWQRAENSRNAPLYYASAVLGDGTVIVAGGEYNFNVPDTDLCAADIYDPLADTWTALDVPKNWTAMGDAPCCVLPDGTFLLGAIANNACALFDPRNRGWTPVGSKLNANSDEETWTLLRDGSVLTADCNGHPATERYIAGTWRNEGNLPDGSDLVDDASKEIGPAILLPDGRVFAIGATGATAVYSPDADQTRVGTWRAGPSFGKYDGIAYPQLKGLPLGAKDAPACLLPNGRVLCAVGPVDAKNGGEYYAPTLFFEYDPKSDKLQLVSDAQHPSGGWSDCASSNVRMLLLPTGEVLLNNGSSSLQIYTPDGAPDAAWKPAITKSPAAMRQGYAYQISGQRLNGMSQACAYGDDAAMATNYPIMRMQSSSGAKSIRYCRTSYHSTMGVATGTAVHSTWVAIPWDLPDGAYELTSIANGIASAPVAIQLSKTAPLP